MPKISRDEAVAALTDAIRESLMRGEEVYVPELGTFHVEHRPSVSERLPSGEEVMQPPRNEIVFSPDE